MRRWRVNLGFPCFPPPLQVIGYSGAANFDEALKGKPSPSDVCGVVPRCLSLVIFLASRPLTPAIRFLPCPHISFPLLLNSPGPPHFSASYLPTTFAGALLHSTCWNHAPSLSRPTPPLLSSVSLLSTQHTHAPVRPPARPYPPRREHRCDPGRRAPQARNVPRRPLQHKCVHC